MTARGGLGPIEARVGDRPGATPVATPIPTAVTPALVDELLAWRSDACVSLYVPTAVVGPATRQNPIRLKNAVAEAEDRLADRGLRSPDADAILRPARALVEAHAFWTRQGPGLAVFADRSAARVCRLDRSVGVLVTVGYRPHVKPLLATLRDDERWWTLALSQNRIRLLACGPERGDVEDVTPADMPANLDEALGHEREEPHLQFHTGTRNRGTGLRPAMFHGQGGVAEEQKDKVLRFCRVVAAHVQPILARAPAPVVLACVEWIAPLYRQAADSDLVLDAHVPGNPDATAEETLRERTRAIVEARSRAALASVVERFRVGRAHGLASSDLRAVLQASAMGRIAELLVPVGRRIWGAYDAASDRLRLLEPGVPDAEDLLDLVAVETLRQGGTVHAVEPEAMPGGDALAAVFRY